MTSNEYIRDEHGYFRCDMCPFLTPHENRIKRHMVKSHDHAPYPPPALFSEKFRDREEPPSAAEAIAALGEKNAQSETKNPKSKKGGKS